MIEAAPAAPAADIRTPTASASMSLVITPPPMCGASLRVPRARAAKRACVLCEGIEGCAAALPARTHACRTRQGGERIRVRRASARRVLLGEDLPALRLDRAQAGVEHRGVDE